NYKLYENDTLRHNRAVTWTSGYPEVGAYRSGEVTYFDNVRVRKYASTEPTTSLGAEQTTIAELVFTTATQTIIESLSSTIMTVESRDSDGDARAVLVDNEVKLSSTSSGGRFSTEAAPTSWSTDNTLTVTISADASSVSFYYKDSIVGTPTITASEYPSMGWTNATQQQTINSAVNSFLVSATTPQVAGSEFTLTITALDEAGETAIEFSGTVNLTVNYISPTSGSGTLSTTSTANFTNGVATITNQTFSDCGTITITATKSDDEDKTGTSINIVFVPYDFTVVASSLDSATASRHTTSKAFTLTVTARNASGVTCPNYKGTADLSVTATALSTTTGSLGTSSLTSSYWSSGIVTLSDQTYDKWGTITVTATDATLTTQAGTSGNVVFIPKDFSITLSDLPASRTFYYIDEDFSATVTARDYNDNTITNYMGTVNFTGTGLDLPGDYIFTAGDLGSHAFSDVSGPSSITNTNISVNDASYETITGISDSINVDYGKIKVINKSATVGTTTVQLQIQDSSGSIITTDDSTTFTVSLTERRANNTTSCSATSEAVTVTSGIANITLSDTEPEIVTVTPSSTPYLVPNAGEINFGGIGEEGIRILYWEDKK
ncbi:MAG: hypothetical protein ABH954_00580, partial [Candidatus Omnitrophota bacterium]